MYLSCNNASINYGNSQALENITFNVEQGDYICIVGKNGSGKSTLLKGILGILPLKTGEVNFDKNVKGIGYLPQHHNVQKDFPASVYEVVLSGCLQKRGIKPFYSKKNKASALDNILTLGINDIKNNPYHSLSGGQQQRVLLARALCATENMLFLDEPTSGLDPAITAELYRLIARLNKSNGLTVLMTSHDITTAAKDANKILHLDGKTIFFGSTNDYLHSEVYSHFLGGGCN